MQRLFPYLFFIILIFVSVSLPENITDPMRGFAVSSMAPSWGFLDKIKSPFKKGSSTIHKTDFSQLSLENNLLRSQIDSVNEWLTFEQRLEEQIDRYLSLKTDANALQANEFFRRRAEELKQILEMQLQSLPAKIVYRDPTSWSSSIWINIGNKENEALGKIIVAKNSPVVVGSSLVGLVEYVGPNHSRVRLITDSGFTPAVRAVRGDTQNRQVLMSLRNCYSQISQREDLFENKEEKEDFFDQMKLVMDKLSSKEKDSFLAKGELSGCSKPLWRSRNQKLKGKGFNYDYLDVEGPERDLHTGKPIKDMKADPLELIKKGDLLITTGMDGIFPPGLSVAVVSKVEDIPKAGYAYEIEALATAENLEDIQVVFVMPPLHFESL